MHMGSRGLSVLLAGFVIGGVGCGGGSGKPTFSSSLPPSATVSSLSASQQKELCDEAISFDEMLLRSPNFCHAFSVSIAASDAASNADWTDAQIQSDCSMWTQFCDALQSSGQSTSSCDPSNCMVTVAQLTTCMNDTGAAFQQYASTLPSCTALTRATVASLATAPAPASCAVVSSMCPSIDTGGNTTTY